MRVMLCAADATDAVFAHCLREKIYSIFDVNELLFTDGERLLDIAPPDEEHESIEDYEEE